MITRIILSIIILSMVFCLCTSTYAAWQVAIFDYDDRLDEPNTVAKYIEEKLTKAEPNLTVVQYSGEGNEAIAVERIKRLDQAGYDLIITVTSDALILAQHFLRTTPTLYTNANNPLSLGFKTLDAPGGNISGASYYVPIAKQIAFFKSIQPDLKKLGFIFDEKNRSRQAEVGESRTVCKTLGLRYAIELISTAKELPDTTKNLLNKDIDAIVVTSSETIYNNLNLFKFLCEQARIPIYSYHRKAVEKGAIAALASDYYMMVEKLVVPMALRVLREQVSPGTMPAAFLDGSLIIINQTEAQKLGVNIPEEILQQAVAVY